MTKKKEQGNSFKNSILRQKVMEFRVSMEGLNVDGIGAPPTVRGRKTAYGYRQEAAGLVVERRARLDLTVAVTSDI